MILNFFSGPAEPPADAFSGITQRRLSNGIRVNYRYSDNEPKAAMLRIIANGGRAAENMTIGPDGFGAVVVGKMMTLEICCPPSIPFKKTKKILYLHRHQSFVGSRNCGFVAEGTD